LIGRAGKARKIGAQRLSNQKGLVWSDPDRAQLGRSSAAVRRWHRDTVGGLKRGGYGVGLTLKRGD
jgi:hypothetical protein